MSTWKRDVGRGLVVLGPILVTLYLISLLYNSISRYVPNLLLNAKTLEPTLGGMNAQTREWIAGLLQVLLFLTLIVILVLMLGYTMRTTFGRVFERSIDETVNRIPGLRLVYNASKTAGKTAFGDIESLQAPVKMETWKGIRMTAFKTGKTTADGRELIFIPTSPNPTTGFVVEADPTDIAELDETVEEALTRIVSAGFGDTTHPGNIMEEGIAIEVIEDFNKNN